MSWDQPKWFAVQINDWLLTAREASSGELPVFPSAADGGSMAILAQAAAAAAQAAEAPAAAKAAAKTPAKAAQTPAPAKKGKDKGEPSLCELGM